MREGRESVSASIFLKHDVVLAALVQRLMKELMCVLKVIHNQPVRPAVYDQHVIHDGIKQDIRRAMMSLIEELCASEALLLKVIEVDTVVRCEQGHAHFGRGK